MKATFTALRALRENLLDIGSAVKASRQFTQAGSTQAVAPRDSGIPL